MLKGKELNMYSSVGKQVRIIDSGGIVITGKCIEFTQACDNDPEEAAITLESPMKGNEKFIGLLELLEHEIEQIEY